MAKAVEPKARCRHRSVEPTGEQIENKARAGERLKVYTCAVYGKCVLKDGPPNGVACCGCACPGRQPIVTADVLRTTPIALPNHFNPGLCEFQGRTYLASRLGWEGGRVHLSELDGSFRVRWTRELKTFHPAALQGSEDPRLFVFDGALHVAFTGYEKARASATSQLVARLDSKLEVESVQAPQYAQRATWEKNWTFFELSGQLHSVYSISPHVVLRHDGTGTMVSARVESALHFGEQTALRGGAPPVRVGAEYYHWFHTVERQSTCTVYGLALYTFDAKPPFAPRRFIPRILLTTDETCFGGKKRVVFVCGALLRQGEWLISYGHSDRECRIAAFSQDGVEAELRAIPT